MIAIRVCGEVQLRYRILVIMIYIASRSTMPKEVDNSSTFEYIQYSIIQSILQMKTSDSLTTGIWTRSMLLMISFGNDLGNQCSSFHKLNSPKCLERDGFIRIDRQN